MKEYIVKMDRSEGDTLTRMKSSYVDLGVKDKDFMTVLVKGQEALFYERFGGSYNVEVDSAPADVFTALALSVVPASGIPAEAEIHDSAVINQAAATISKVDDSNYKIEADFSKLVTYVSDDATQATLGPRAWLAVAIATGESTIIGTSFGGKELTEQDVTEATTVGLAAGSFVLWLQLENGTRTILLGRDGKYTTVTISVVDTQA